LKNLSSSADRLKACKTLSVTQLVDYINPDYFTKPILLELSQMGLSHIFTLQDNFSMHEPRELFLLFNSSVIILREILIRNTSDDIENRFDRKDVENTLNTVIDEVIEDTSLKLDWHRWGVVRALALCLCQKAASQLKTASQLADSVLPVISRMFADHKKTIILPHAMHVVKEYILRWTEASIQRGKLNQLLTKLQHTFGNEIESIEKLLCINVEIVISPSSKMLETIEQLASVIAPESSQADKQSDSKPVERLAPLLALRLLIN
jgi:hypothetical protein